MKRKTILLIPCLLILMSCAPAVKPKIPELVWPLPPDPPKIKYIGYVRGTMDIRKKVDITASIFGAEEEAFRRPSGIASGPDGRLYVADRTKVWVIDLEKGEFSFIGESSGPGRLMWPMAVAVSADGRLFVGDVLLDRVYIYDTEGRLIAAIGHEGEFDSPSGLAIDEKLRRLYISDTKKHYIKVYDLDTYKPIMTIGKRGSEKGEFNFPIGITVDRDGLVYVVDSANFRVQVFDPDGKFIRSWGEVGDRPGMFSRPKNIAIDTEGHIYVVDMAFQNVQIFDKDGQILMAFSSGGSEPGYLNMPFGITIDKNNSIYVTENLGRRFQIFQYLGGEVK